MKTLKSLFMLCAGLSFCACSSDNEPQIPEGTGMVEVKIVNPSTRAEGAPITVTGSITVTLYYDTDKVLTQTVAAGSNDPVKFWNITDPIKVTASINGGIDTYASTPITQTTGDGGNLQAAPEEIPAYGETPYAEFKLVGTMSPTGTEGNESGYVAGDESKTFQKWSANVQMAIPVARLEVGTISHESHTAQDDNCLFSNLQIKGVYLDKVANYGGAYSSANDKFSEASATEQDDSDGFTEALLSSNKDAAAVDFKTNSFAASAFNFYANGSNPIFKVYFTQAHFADGDNNQTREGWAMITRYKELNQETSQYEDVAFENGVVYQIANVTLSDENIVGDEENEAVYGVEVTVTRAQWRVKTIEAEWAQ